MSDERYSFNLPRDYKVNLRINEVGMEYQQNCRMIISWKLDKSLITTLPVEISNDEKSVEMKEEFE
jgi:hypothetical protein